MNKIKKIIQNINHDYFFINTNDIINILDNLTNIELNIIFNKLYYSNYSNDYNVYDHTFLQKIYLNYPNGSEILKDLLKRYKYNININIKNLDGKTLLYYVAFSKNMEILELIYELYKDVNVNVLNNYNDTILYDVMRFTCYNEKIVKFLLEKNAKIQYKLLIYIIDSYNIDENYTKKFVENVNILLEYLHTNNNYSYDYILEELYKYVIKNYKINEDNKEFYDKIFVIKSNTKSAAKILALI